MSDKLSVNALLKELKSGPFVTGCQMPMGYAPGLPLMSVRNGCLCISFPYLKYKMTGERDRTLVYPARFIITLLLPEGRPVEFRDLSLDPRFAEVNFEKPVGLFRHPAIQHLDKKGYDALRSELLGLYGRLADALLGGSPFSTGGRAAHERAFQPALRAVSAADLQGAGRRFLPQVFKAR